MFDGGVATMDLGLPTDDPAAVRRQLGLADASDGGSPAALIRRLLQLTEYARLRSHGEAELLEIAAALGSVEAWAAAAQRDAAATLQARRGRIDARRAGRVEMAGSAADSLAMRLGVSRRRASRLVGEGHLFQDVLHPVGTALASGDLDAGKASVFADMLVEQPPEVCFAVCEQVLPDAPGLTHHALRGRIQAVIVQVDPRTAHERAVRAAGQRRVEAVRILPDGQASLRLVAPLMDVVAVHTMTEAAARAARAGGDPRTLDQLRADALVAVATEALTAGRIEVCGGRVGDVSPTAPSLAHLFPLPDGQAERQAEHRADVRPAATEPRGLEDWISPSDVPDGASLDEAVAATKAAVARLRVDTSPRGAVRRAAAAAASADVRRRRRRRRHPSQDPLSIAGAILDPEAAAPPAFPPFSGTSARLTLALDSAHLKAPRLDASRPAVPDHAVDPSGVASHDAGADAHADPGRSDPAPVAAEPCAADVYAWEFAHAVLRDGEENPYETFEAPTTCRPGVDVPEILGFGPLDPTTARALAVDPPPYLRVAVGDRDEEASTAGEPTSPGYVPGAALARQVRRAHPTCVAPSCSVPSTSCDLDHVVPWPAGATDAHNLRPLCRHHHLIKTHLGHALALDPDGAAVWRTPEGHTYRRAVGGASRLIEVPTRVTRPGAA